MPVQEVHCHCHGLLSGFSNVDSVDLIRLNDSSADGESQLQNPLIEKLPHRRGEFLGVLELFLERWNGKDDRSSNDGTCKWSSSCFVDACDEPKTLTQEPLLKEILRLVKERPEE